MSYRFFTSESVLPGHPDKLCDQISDAILDAILRKDRTARVAIDTTVTKGVCHIFGEVGTRAGVDYERIARNVMKQVGYTDEEIGMDYRTCEVITDVHEQSPEIARAVVKKREIGAGDQGIMFGYAIKHTEELMPLPIMLAHRLAERLYRARVNKVLPYLRPDGKTQVTVEFEDGLPVRVDSVVLAAQHDGSVPKERIEEDLIKYVILPVIGEWMDSNTKIYINRSGRFVMGGPAADSGLTGKKPAVDTYGGWAHHGGGCLSGKDPTKVDRSAAYMARFVAKNIVGLGLADEFELQLAYVIGRPKPVSVSFETFGTEHVNRKKIEKVVNRFTYRPKEMIEMLNLRRPIYRKTAVFGHFGRDIFPWERIRRALFR